MFYQPLVFSTLLELSTGPPSPVTESPINREKEKGREENRSKEGMMNWKKRKERERERKRKREIERRG